MKYLLLWFALSQGLDTTSTCMQLRDGMSEGNPLLPSSCKKIALVKSGLTASTILVASKLDNKHPKLAKIGIGVVASSTSVVVGLNWTK